MLTAARALILRKGFAGTTIADIAAKAGVAAPTVYATFGSKKGIVAGLLDRARFGEAYEAAVSSVLELKDAAGLLRGAARIARTIYEAERTELALLSVSPELAQMEKERDAMRFTAQQPVVDSARKQLKVPPDEARAVLWTLTGRDLFSSLVEGRGWTPARYEKWLGELLVSTLLK